jgi:hypothetical protein
MSNYVQTTLFTPKDSLPTSDPNKTIFGAAYDVEFGNISTAIASKLDVVATTSSTATAFIPTGAAIPVNGLYLPAANTIGLASNTTLRISANSAGNVVIAAPSSGTALTVNGAAATSLVASFLSASGVNPSLTLDSAGGTYSSALNLNSSAGGGSTISASQVLQLSTAAAVRLSIAAAGNVTINAPSSGTALTVNGLSGANTFILGSTGAASTLNTAWSVLLGTGWDIFTQSTDPLNIGTSGAASASIFTNSAARITTNSTGNVTINAPSSGQALTVTGLAGADSSAIVMTGRGFTSALAFDTSGSFFDFQGAQTFRLYTNGVQRLSINSTGSVNIPAPTSGTALTVNGAAGANALVVNGNAWTAVNAIGNSSTAFTVDFSKSNVQTVTMNGNVAAGSMTLSNVSSGQTVNLLLTQDGVGSRTLGNATGVKWPAGVVGVLSTAPNAIDMITFTNIAGTTYATLTKGFA